MEYDELPEELKSALIESSGSVFKNSSSISEHLKKKKLNHFVKDLNLIKEAAKILASRPQNRSFSNPVNIHHRANVGFSAAGLAESWQNCQHLTNFLPIILPSSGLFYLLR